MSTAPKGFRFATACAGFRKEGRADLALLVSDVPAVAAGTFTQNRFPAAPVLVAKAMLAERPAARAVVTNSGQANACTGDEGMRNCRTTQELVAGALGLEASDILPASTGVIGAQLKMDLWEKAAPALAANLGKATPEDFARAIMTTDAFHKISHREVSLPGGVVKLVGMAKGAGMICPNMATMLSVVLCDAQVEASVWQKMLRDAVEPDLQPRDRGRRHLHERHAVWPCQRRIRRVRLRRGIAQGAVRRPDLRTRGSGLYAGKGRRGRVQGCPYPCGRGGIRCRCRARGPDGGALAAGKDGPVRRDANWGRIVAAVGRSGADFNPDDVVVTLCGVELFRKGQPTDLDFDALLEEPLKQRDLPIDIVLGSGSGSYTLLASDLGHEYVNVNADYRS